MKKTNLNSECKDLEFIIENLLTGKESCETEDSQYSPEDAIDYLQGFLQELNELNTQIIEQGNTPELLDCVFKKYTELWLFHFRLYSSCRLLSIELCRIKLQSDYNFQQKKELCRELFLSIMSNYSSETIFSVTKDVSQKILQIIDR